jgi:hypothetical protein
MALSFHIDGHDRAIGFIGPLAETVSRSKRFRCYACGLAKGVLRQHDGRIRLFVKVTPMSDTWLLRWADRQFPASYRRKPDIGKALNQ